jgi:hypothetical protein
MVAMGRWNAACTAASSQRSMARLEKQASLKEIAIERHNMSTSTFRFRGVFETYGYETRSEW